MENKFYILVSTIPYTTFKKNDVFMVDGENNVFVNGILLNTGIEHMLNFKDSKYFKPMFMKFKVGDILRYKFRPKEGTKVYQVTDINPTYITLKEYFTTRAETVPNSPRYTDAMQKVGIYYFISSKGIVQYDVTGKDVMADEYRKRIGNYFKTKEEANRFELKAINTKEFTNFMVISFLHDGKKYQHRINVEDITIQEDVDTWFAYFDENGYHFEVWGSLNEYNQPMTSGTDKNGGAAQFAVNVYNIEDGEGTQETQIDDIDIIDCD